MPNQKQLDKTFIDIADSISKLSNCRSFNVGCVIVKDGRMLTSGYNGTPAGFMNCSDKFEAKPMHFGPPQPWCKREEHHEFSENFEIHGELNAILYAARHGICIEGSTLYCTLQPCRNCLKNLCQSGIVRIVYRDPYDKCGYTEETHMMLEACGVILEQYKDNIPKLGSYDTIICGRQKTERHGDKTIVTEIDLTSCSIVPKNEDNC